MEITAKELHEKSIQQQVTHRKSFDQLTEDQRWKFEAFAEWCNQLIADKFKLQDRLADEFALERGLDIRSYPSKWKQAKDLALWAKKAAYPEETALECACRLFVELGGSRQTAPKGENEKKKK